MAAFRQAWLRADALGVDTLWTWDHFFPQWDTDPNGPYYEGWTTVAGLGPQLRSARVGNMVLSIGYRNPALLSKMATTLDHLLDGRLILGLGTGWFRPDYEAYGYSYGTAAERLADLERSLTTIRERWALDHPRPIRGTIPLLVAGGGERVTLRIVAQQADLWNTFSPLAAWARKNRVLDAWCERVGRDPAAVERTVTIRAEEVDQADDFVAAGASHLIVSIPAPHDLEPLERLLAWRDRARQRAGGR
jgi:probable F420-dependent oxidoreductase